MELLHACAVEAQNVDVYMELLLASPVLLRSGAQKLRVEQADANIMYLKQKKTTFFKSIYHNLLRLTYCRMVTTGW